MPVLLRAARGRGQLAGLSWLMVIATLFVPHSDCTHQPSPAQPGSRTTAKKGHLSHSLAAGPRSRPRLGGYPLIGGLSLLCGHFTFCAEAEKCQELGMGMRKGWRKVARCWGCQVCCRPGHLSSFLRYTATSSFSASPLVITSQSGIKGFVII